MTERTESVQRAISMELIDKARIDVLDFEFARLLEELPGADMVILRLERTVSDG